MPTILSHAAVPLALGLGFGRALIPRRLLLAGIAVAILPDLDILAFRFGIPYAAEFGHRGFSHSLLFAAMIAVVLSLAARQMGTLFTRAYLFLFLAAASHGILDAFTTGGLGIALLWPMTERYFAPVQVIKVSSIGIAHFLSPKGIAVLRSEAIWVLLPAFALMTWLMALRYIAGFARQRRGRERQKQGSASRLRAGAEV